MIKKLLRAGVILGAAVAAVTGMSAFEAHVINVTAKIENALAVSTKRWILVPFFLRKF